MRIATFNVNGIRAADRRGLRTWLAEGDFDVVALQEVRCPAELVPNDLFEGYHLAYDPGTIPGRNGVAVASRTPPLAVRAGFGSREFDPEGRYLEVDLPGLTVASVYVPKGASPSADETANRAYARKMRFMSRFRRHLTQARRDAARQGREFVVMGDFNIAHTEQDLRNWRTNKRSPGFLPEERDWFSGIVTPRTLIDVVRRLHPDADGPYSWWTWRGQAWNTDAGWRIDYHLASPALAPRASNYVVARYPSYEARWSDHAPVIADYDL